MRGRAPSSQQDDRYGRLISSRRWQQLRRWKLSQNPACERCDAEGRLTPATCVHHVRPVESAASYRDMAALCFNPGNLQSLCRKCHSDIHTEMGSRSAQKQRRRHEAELDEFKKNFL